MPHKRTKRALVVLWAVSLVLIVPFMTSAGVLTSQYNGRHQVKPADVPYLESSSCSVLDETHYQSTAYCRGSYAYSQECADYYNITWVVDFPVANGTHVNGSIVEHYAYSDMASVNRREQQFTGDHPYPCFYDRRNPYHVEWDTTAADKRLLTTLIALWVVTVVCVVGFVLGIGLWFRLCMRRYDD